MRRSSLVLLALVMGCAAPQLPKALRPPPGQRVVARTIGRGKQIYVCQRGEDGVHQWTLREPMALLFDERGLIVGQHYVGPTWEATDGSRVVGVKQRAADSPDHAIPWLLLAAASTSGDGTFGGVSWIQRVDTHGGVAPSSACDAARAGQVSISPYQATYVFYARAAAKR